MKLAGFVPYSSLATLLIVISVARFYFHGYVSSICAHTPIQVRSRYDWVTFALLWVLLVGTWN